MKGFSSMYEANQINGVYFAGCNPDEGYVDDFGYWRSYEWTDSFQRTIYLSGKDSGDKSSGLFLL